MHSFVTSKNVKWCQLIWPTVYSVVSFVTYMYNVSLDEQVRRGVGSAHSSYRQHDDCGRHVHRKRETVRGMTAWLITCLVFHRRLKINLFHKSFPQYSQQLPLTELNLDQTHNSSAFCFCFICSIAIA